MLSRDGASKLLPSMPGSVTALIRGDAVCRIAAGGAGYGHPWERDAQAVLDDVLDERISERIYAGAHLRCLLELSVVLSCSSMAS
ncbi:hypothetical protein [Paraburkholderia lycopersici]|uniref:hypothetical protein n=1 Tax=Paraburkholderia lycopersici TaxID=416944 RepID=UPI001C40911E|nr:hypothetical protein [Paraburkholderia lycopersici]